ncbi:hypothetical protein HK405_014848 [Cladochytrium tenue]|nr:hypothetical protein HK405_014848 [Cladochytrium tenue]
MAGGAAAAADATNLEDEIKREGAESDATYFLPSDDAERKRLHMQHIVTRHLFGGLFLTPQQAIFEDSSSDAKILDIGCGPGSWALEMAKKFPHASVVVSKMMQSRGNEIHIGERLSELAKAAGLQDVTERVASFPVSHDFSGVYEKEDAPRSIAANT